MEKTALLTDWLTIATAGKTRTRDNFVITEQHLSDMVESYDPKLAHCATINIEHFRGWNLGTVREIRLNDDAKNRKILEARLAPNEDFISRNKAGYGLFFSAEIDLNYLDSGKAYLIGLASTDNPASPGTTEVHFSSDENKKCFCAFTEESQTLALATNNETDDKTENAFKAFCSEFMKFFKANNNKETPEENEMGMTAEETKKFEEQEQKIAELSTAVDGFKDSVDNLVAKFSAKETGDGDEKGGEGSEEETKSDDANVELSAKVDGLVEKMDIMVENLKKFGAQPGASTTVDLSTGGESDSTFI
ncbi:GPO family capsid scaffolding protein [Lentisphaerota bacterium WC36G]|nr:GPO family capsid scaffolding protein [Lentisphaerae bacterium WC36]